MRENRQEFKVGDIVKLSKLPSLLINDLLEECDIYLSKRILCYVLAQQVNIQISSDIDLSALRGYVGELEDYTFNQLINFTESHNIIIDTVDFKFRVWTVIFNNLERLGITTNTLDKYLVNTEYCFEHASEIFENLTRFVDERNDIDGQPFIVARESLARFSNRDELIAFGKSLDIYVPHKKSKEEFLELLLHKLEDNTEALRNELNQLTLLELEEYAYKNYQRIDATLNKKDIINYILDCYSPVERSIINIDYINYLQIPSLSKGLAEEESTYISDLKPKKVFDDSLKDMISTISNAENSNDEISEEQSKKELDSLMDSIVTGLNHPVNPKKEQTIQESLMIKRIDDLERRLNITEERQVTDRESQLLKRIEELEQKLLLVTKEKEKEIEQLKEINEQNNQDEQSYTKQERIDNYKEILKDLVEEKTDNEEVNSNNEFNSENDLTSINSIEEDEIEAEFIETYENQDKEISEEIGDDVSQQEVKVTNTKELEEKFIETQEKELELKLNEEIKEVNNTNVKDEVIDNEKTKFDTAFDDYIEEIHSAKGKKKIKARRRHSVKPVVVFWKSIAAWVSVVGLVATILWLYNYFIL